MHACTGKVYYGTRQCSTVQDNMNPPTQMAEDRTSSPLQLLSPSALAIGVITRAVRRSRRGKAEADVFRLREVSG